MIAQIEPEMSGASLRDAAINQVAESHDAYRARFFACAARLLSNEGSVASETVVSIIGMPAGSPNAVGASMRMFAKAYGLRVAFYRKSNTASRHAGVIAVWRLP